MKKVVLGLVGTTLDRGFSADRWNQWRPTVSLFQHEELLIDRYDLLYQSKFSPLAEVISEDIASISPETEIRKHTVEFNDAWDFEDVYGALHEFARQYPFDTDQEEYLIHISTGTHVVQICLFLLTESRHLPGKLIQSSPPERKSAREPGKYRVIDLDLSRYDRIAQRFLHERSESLVFLKSGIDTRNGKFNTMIEQIEHVAIHSKDPLLLVGPTGAGKTNLARRIYELKKIRRQVKGKFVEVNCATLRGDAAMSTLFGHRKGAFTGALQDREGLLRQADGGLLFLDEVGELGGDEQAMLLRAIEDKCFLPLGSDHEVQSNFQLICGTNRELLMQDKETEFRKDLLARINLWSFQLPGLKNRKEDIEPNIIYELSRIAMREGKNFRFNKEALHEYLHFAKSNEAAWTYNFRDLSSSITRMSTMALSGRITVDIVKQEIERLKQNWGSVEARRDSSNLISLFNEESLQQIDRFDYVQLEEVIRVCLESSSLSEAGRTLFSVSRKKRKMTNDADRLRKYLTKFGLDWDQVQALK